MKAQYCNYLNLYCVSMQHNIQQAKSVLTVRLLESLQKENDLELDKESTGT